MPTLAELNAGLDEPCQDVYLERKDSGIERSFVRIIRYKRYIVIIPGNVFGDFYNPFFQRPMTYELPTCNIAISIFNEQIFIYTSSNYRIFSFVPNDIEVYTYNTMQPPLEIWRAEDTENGDEAVEDTGEPDDSCLGFRFAASDVQILEPGIFEPSKPKPSPSPLRYQFKKRRIKL